MHDQETTTTMTMTTLPSITIVESRNETDCPSLVDSDTQSAILEPSNTLRKATLYRRRRKSTLEKQPPLGLNVEQQRIYDTTCLLENKYLSKCDRIVSTLEQEFENRKRKLDVIKECCKTKIRFTHKMITLREQIRVLSREVMSTNEVLVNTNLMIKKLTAEVKQPIVEKKIVEVSVPKSGIEKMYDSERCCLICDMDKKEWEFAYPASCSHSHCKQCVQTHCDTANAQMYSCMECREEVSAFTHLIKRGERIGITSWPYFAEQQQNFIKKQILHSIVYNPDNEENAVDDRNNEALDEDDDDDDDLSTIANDVLHNDTDYVPSSTSDDEL